MKELSHKFYNIFRTDPTPFKKTCYEYYIDTLIKYTKEKNKIYKSVENNPFDLLIYSGIRIKEFINEYIDDSTDIKKEEKTSKNHKEAYIKTLYTIEDKQFLIGYYGDYLTNWTIYPYNKTLSNFSKKSKSYSNITYRRDKLEKKNVFIIGYTEKFSLINNDLLLNQLKDHEFKLDKLDLRFNFFDNGEISISKYFSYYYSDKNNERNKNVPAQEYGKVYKFNKDGELAIEELFIKVTDVGEIKTVKYDQIKECSYKFLDKLNLYVYYELNKERTCKYI